MFRIIAQFHSLVSFLRFWKESSFVDFLIILNVIIFCILLNTVSLNIAPLVLIFLRVLMTGVSLCNPRNKLQLFILISPKPLIWFLTRNCLPNYTLRGNVLLWLQNFFSCCTLQTKIDSSLSGIADLISGVVQGSGIGPLMFLTYINKLLSVLEQHNIKVKLFADDVKM